MSIEEQPIWQLILRAAERLGAPANDFRLFQVIKEIQLINPQLERTSIQPVVQGMTSNAGKGPTSPCGKPFLRVSHGVYRLNVEAHKLESHTTNKSSSAAVKASSKTVGAGRSPHPTVRDVTEHISADIVLVSCVKTKLSEVAAARDLYTSPLFRKERAYAELQGVPWYILSAEYGLVSPLQRIAPYERYLPKESQIFRDNWGARVVAELDEVEGPIRGKVIEVHSNAVYLEAIRSRLQSHGAVIVEPLLGLQFGKRLQWYDRHFHESQPTSN